MFLILERSKRDILYKDEYLIHIQGPSAIPNFIKSFLKRNNIRLRGQIDVSYLKKVHEGVHKLRRQHEEERTRRRTD